MLAMICSVSISLVFSAACPGVLTFLRLPVPVWASLGDAREVEDRLAKVKADLLCEMAAVSATTIYVNWPFDI